MKNFVSSIHFEDGDFYSDRIFVNFSLRTFLEKRCLKCVLLLVVLYLFGVLHVLSHSHCVRTFVFFDRTVLLGI